MAHDVFICHSSDDRQIADAVCHALESRGIRCWIAPRDLPLGTDWAEGIVEGIEDCRIMVLVFSSHANASVDVRKEVGFAINEGLDVLPFRVEDVRPSKGLAYHLSSLHWLDATTPPLERHISDLADKVALLVEHMASAPAASDEADASVARQRRPLVSPAKPLPPVPATTVEKVATTPESPSSSRKEERPARRLPDSHSPPDRPVLPEFPQSRLISPSGAGPPRS